MQRSLRSSIRANQRRLQFELLEDRAMLAGTVTGTLVGDTWTILGDADNNQVRVVQNANGSWELIGQNGTAVAGDIDDVDPVAIISINFEQGGNDTLTVQGRTGLGLSGDLGIAMGGGNDKVTVNNLTTGTQTSINASAGNDTIATQNVTTGAWFDILGGDGNNSVTMRNSIVHGEGESFLFTGFGRDSILVDRYFNAGTLLVATAEGDDKVSISRAKVAVLLNIDTGADGGKDVVALTLIQTTDLTAVLGDGNDSLAITTCKVDNVSDLNGGDGTRDKLVVTLSDLGANPTIENFETQIFLPRDLWRLPRLLFSALGGL